MPYPIRNLVIKSTIEFSYFSDMSSHNSNNRSEKYFKLSSALNSYLCIKVGVRGQNKSKYSRASSKMFVCLFFLFFILFFLNFFLILGPDLFACLFVCLFVSDIRY